MQVCKQYNIDSYLRTLLYRLVEGKSCRQTEILQDHLWFPIEDYKLLLKSQNRIGWRNLSKGYVSVQWNRHQSRYVAMMKVHTKDDTGTWLSKVIGCLIK